MTTQDLFVSAYITAPADPDAHDAFFDAVATLDLGGLEFGLFPEGDRTLDLDWIDAHVPAAWELVVTLVPTMMTRLGTQPAYGLASLDEAGRATALADVARARDLALALADRYGRRRVGAIEVHSAPGPELGSIEAFERSLTEILGWDLAGAELLVEHCDERLPGQSPAKGFLGLDAELALVQKFGLPADVLGMSVNWGRSVIEGRSTATAVEHTRTVAEAGLLRALVLSGATDAHTAWGTPWGDMHIPPRGSDPAFAASAASLLGPDEVAETLAAAGDVPRVGLKWAARPAEADVATRLAIITASIDQVVEARQGARAVR
jgi:hypothetical protein